MHWLTVNRGQTQEVSSTGEPQHLVALDGVRGLAILAVLVAHGINFLQISPADPQYLGLYWRVQRVLLQGWGGVELFFTLSGFLITGILLRARGRENYFRNFYGRRALRIFPIYYVVLTALMLLAQKMSYLASALPGTALQRFSFFIYLQNWPIFWKSWDGITSILGVYWSLAEEEQFYLVWPTIVRYLKPSLLLAACVAGFALGWPERALLTHLVGYKLGVMQWPLSRLDGLFLGAALALYREVFRKPLSLRAAAVLFALGAGLFLRIVIFHSDELLGSGTHIWTSGVTAIALMSCGLVAATHYKLPWLDPVLSFRPLVLMGKYSYGMYMYHLLIYHLINRHAWLIQLLSPDFHPLLAYSWIGIGILLTFAIAALSFHLFERRFLKLKRYFPSPPARV